MTMCKMAVRAALVAAMGLPMSAMAVNLYGGGATYPANPYVGPVTVGSTLYTTLGTGLPISSESIFGTYAGFSTDNVSYCLTGSGRGKTTQISGDASVACATGFSAPAGQTLPNFIGTDSPYSQTEHNNFKAARGATKTAVVQVPSLVGVIALPFKNADVTGNITLTTNDVCNIFFGVYTDWNQIPNLGLPSKAIRVVGRSDNSGTSFAFSNFAARNCNAASGGPIPANSAGNAQITTNQTFSATGLRQDLLVSGNPLVVSTTYATEGAIGYGDPGDVFSQGGAFVLVNGQSPQSFTPPQLTASDLLTDSVVQGVNAVTGLPAVVPAASNIPTSITLVNPTLVATTGYPIIAWTYLDTYARQNDAADVGGDANAFASLQLLLSCVTDGTLGCRPAAAPAGYAFLDLDSDALTEINAAIAEIQ
jgi:ABC-type phosphate transport system substrate-binding protein